MTSRLEREISPESTTINGVVRKGKRIASGLARDPETGLINTVGKQMKFFIEHGVEGSENLFPGTINVNIAPCEFKILKPDYEIRDIPWVGNDDPLVAPAFINFRESFQLVGVMICANGDSYKGYIYYPMPSVVKSHPDTTMEVLSEKIPDLAYGDAIQIVVNRAKVETTNSDV